eukprot:CAMPEP_0169431796 /NCGR_PEP_ID=MMETSP1042-20121227/3137_1 /TAXON_ID=464988 /ORGANISM="Hemiselmis andersenii, Strain CCMP1180" /LENGTH=383 /DNA_ID=CAMNT_0009542229 /DNA_START=198 /DNA_END=1345 /DNA_ORIENTATION=-
MADSVESIVKNELPKYLKILDEAASSLSEEQETRVSGALRDLFRVLDGVQGESNDPAVQETFDPAAVGVGVDTGGAEAEVGVEDASQEIGATRQYDDGAARPFDDGNTLAYDDFEASDDDGGNEDMEESAGKKTAEGEKDASAEKGDLDMDRRGAGDKDGDAEMEEASETGDTGEARKIVEDKVEQLAEGRNEVAKEEGGGAHRDEAEDDKATQEETLQETTQGGNNQDSTETFIEPVGKDAPDGDETEEGEGGEEDDDDVDDAEIENNKAPASNLAKHEEKDRDVDSDEDEDGNCSPIIGQLSTMAHAKHATEDVGEGQQLSDAGEDNSSGRNDEPCQATLAYQQPDTDDEGVEDEGVEGSQEVGMGGSVSVKHAGAAVREA